MQRGDDFCPGVQGLQEPGQGHHVSRGHCVHLQGGGEAGAAAATGLVRDTTSAGDNVSTYRGVGGAGAAAATGLVRDTTSAGDNVSTYRGGGGQQQHLSFSWLLASISPLSHPCPCPY